MWVISVELPGTAALWSQIFGGQNAESAVQTVELRYRIEIQRYRPGTQRYMYNVTLTVL